MLLDSDDECVINRYVNSTLNSYPIRIHGTGGKREAGTLFGALGGSPYVLRKQHDRIAKEN